MSATVRLLAELDERRRRLWAAAEARAAGRGGIAATARATGMAVETIRKGIRELESGATLEPGRVRRCGGGRKRVSETDPALVADLERLVDGASRGDPELPLRWTSNSVRKLADGLRELGHRVSYRTVARLLRALGYSLRANRKTREGAGHPDRDAQFEHDRGEPVISVDFANGGREWWPEGSPELVRVHDFKTPSLARRSPIRISSPSRGSVRRRRRISGSA